jgi:hypothetical protein
MQPENAHLTWADISKAERVVAYRPQPAFEAGLQKIVAWYRHRDSFEQAQQKIRDRRTALNLYSRCSDAEGMATAPGRWAT